MGLSFVARVDMDFELLSHDVVEQYLRQKGFTASLEHFCSESNPTSIPSLSNLPSDVHDTFANTLSAMSLSEILQVLHDHLKKTQGKPT